jgi:hypothetical protein
MLSFFSKIAASSQNNSRLPSRRFSCVESKPEEPYEERIKKKGKLYALFVSTGRALEMCDLISPGMDGLGWEFIFLNLSELLNCFVKWLTKRSRWPDPVSRRFADEYSGVVASNRRKGMWSDLQAAAP